MTYEAVVYDLDGTLARLAVDWGAVRDEVALKLQARGVETESTSLWEFLELSDREPLERIVEETIADHEREGARRSTRLPTADELPRDVPVAVCSLNCEAACRIALEIHGLDSHVDVIVGRDTVETYKPDPEPLLYAISELGASPAETIFVGDSKRDAETAERAGVDFAFVADR